VAVLAGHLAGELPEGATVLDVGCGDGSIAAAILEQRQDLEITGIDVLVRPSTQVPVTPFDGRTIPYPDDSFRAVTFVDVLHHTDDPSVLLAEAARVATEAVVIKDHVVEGLAARPVLRAMDWAGNASHGVALPYNYWTAEQWDRGFAGAGLEVERSVSRLGLYRPPVSWACERGLHRVWRLRPPAPQPSTTGAGSG
jgi:SAM-dependent methyltransferase